MSRVYNFSAGPSILPLEVLEQVKEDLLNYKGTGQSVMEMSHRSKEYQKIIDEAEADLRELMTGMGWLLGWRIWWVRERN